MSARNSTPQNWALEEIIRERERQEKKWGRQKHENRTWLTIASEEFGEVAKAMLERDGVRKEVIQTAAVLVAWLEDGFERGEYPTEENGEFNDEATSFESKMESNGSKSEPSVIASESPEGGTRVR